MANLSLLLTLGHSQKYPYLQNGRLIQLMLNPPLIETGWVLSSASKCMLYVYTTISMSTAYFATMSNVDVEAEQCDQIKIAKCL